MPSSTEPRYLHLVAKRALRVWQRTGEKRSINVATPQWGHGFPARGIRVDEKTHPVQALGWITGLSYLNCRRTVVNLNGRKRLSRPDPKRESGWLGRWLVGPRRR